MSLRLLRFFFIAPVYTYIYTLSLHDALPISVEMSSKILDGPDVVAYGMFRKITTLEFFQHRFAKMGHGNTSCDPHLYQSHQATNAPLPHAKRPPRSGYVH